MEAGFEISETFPAKAKDVYTAWMNSQGHSSMTGSAARIEGNIGGKFSAWDGYITGTTLELTPGRHILQVWQTTEFPTEAADSRLEVLLEEKDGITTVTLLHSQLPSGQVESYRQGWQDYYFKPMKQYFRGQ